MSRTYSVKKHKYVEKLLDLLQEYKSVIIVEADHVGSYQMQQIRTALRGKAEVLMGKNTMIRRVVREAGEHDANLNKLLQYIYGNIGLVFTNAKVKDIREVIQEYKVPAAARPGVVAPIDVFIPAGVTGLDPGQTSFFQALGIGTKIARGSIEIINEVHLIRKGDRVGNSEVALLSKLNVKPFSYGLVVHKIYEGGSVYDPSILDITSDDLARRFFQGVTTLASISLAIGYPTAASLPHHVLNGFKKLVAIALETGYMFPEAQKFKDYLDNPDAFVAAAPAAGGGGPAAAGGAQAAVDAPEPDAESSDAGAGGGLFGADEESD